MRDVNNDRLLVRRAVIEMDIKWLKTFVTAAKYENFRKASEELFLTQPAVTKHIKRLEDHLHINLFERKGKISFLLQLDTDFFHWL